MQTESHPLALRSEVADAGTPLSSLRERHQERLFSLMRRQLPVRILHLAPLFPDIPQTLESYAEFCGLPPQDAADYIDQFLTAGLWAEGPEGRMELRHLPTLKLGNSSVEEHLGSTLALIDRLRPDGPCWYESLVFATTEDLKREFYKSVYDAIQTLMKKSEGQKPDCLMVWSHQGFDYVKENSKRVSP